MSNGATAEQADALRRELADLRGEVRAVRRALRRHERGHREAEAQRARERRRLWGIALALLLSVDGPLITILLARR